MRLEDLGAIFIYLLISIYLVLSILILSKHVYFFYK